MIKDAGTVVVHFGKHQGKMLCDIPSGYLKWLAENCDFEDICEAADVEHSFRSKFNNHFEE